jgi:hypothetical protein
VPLTGSYELGIGGYCDNITISIQDDDDTLKEKLGKLPGVAGRRLVRPCIALAFILCYINPV